MVKIKICGITNEKDLRLALETKPDMLGFIRYLKSPRCVNTALLKQLAKIVPKDVLKVGVYVNESIENVQRDLDENLVDAVQFHGDESPRYCSSFLEKGVFVIKSFSPQNIQDVENFKKYLFNVNAILLDAYSKVARGGTGKKADWEVAKFAVASGYKIILAGGLVPENVSEAIRKVNPMAVDVSSGVEIKPGIKSAEKMKKFVENARLAGGENV